MIRGGVRLVMMHPRPTATGVCVSSRRMPIRGNLFGTAVPGKSRACHMRTPVCRPRTNIVSLKDDPMAGDMMLGPGFNCVRVFSLPRRSTGICVSAILMNAAPCHDSHVTVGRCGMHVRGRACFPVSAMLAMTTNRAMHPAFQVVSAVGPGVPVGALILLRTKCGPGSAAFNTVLKFNGGGGNFCVNFHDSFNSTKDSLRYGRGNAVNSKDVPPFCGRKIARRSHVSIATKCFHHLGGAVCLCTKTKCNDHALSCRLSRQTRSRDKGDLRKMRMGSADGSPAKMTFRLNNVLHFGGFLVSTKCRAMGTGCRRMDTNVNVVFWPRGMG